MTSSSGKSREDEMIDDDVDDDVDDVIADDDDDDDDDEGFIDIFFVFFCKGVRTTHTATKHFKTII